MKMIFRIIIASVLFLQVSHASEKVENIEENLKRMGFSSFFKKIKNDRPVKIAIFDYGFDGYEQEKGISIPKNTEYLVRPGDENIRDPQDINTHGLAMAQIITQYMTKDYNLWSFAPEIVLYKSDGYSNFEWAINDAMRNGVDIILHSIVMEYGSNYNGKGFYNALVNRATSSGIVWVNAAGNFGLTTYNTPVVKDADNWIKMKNVEKDALPIKCAAPTCNVRLVLAWDDFKNEPLTGTTKDLDLYLEDSNFQTIATSQMKQINLSDANNGGLTNTLYPREIIETEIPKGTSYIKVKAETNNFVAEDRLRITADGQDISFPVRDKEESLLNPADNPSVITVGENSERSSVSRSLNKPEFIAPSLVKDDDGRQYMGSSNSAAVVAAGIGLMKEINPNLDRAHILALLKARDSEQVSYSANIPMKVPSELDAAFVQSQDYSNASLLAPPASSPRHTSTIPTKVLGFAAASNLGCYPLADVKMVEPCIVGNFIVNSQSLLVATTAGLKIATTFDPLLLTRYPSRQNINDVVAIFPTEEDPFRVLPRNIPLPRGAIEIFKMPSTELVCKLPDWDFLMSELEVSRRRVYEANATGVYNNYIPQSCRAEQITIKRSPRSNWDNFPVLQSVPYQTAPVESNYFQLPAPSEIENEGYHN
jgi:hypothetical protein